MPDFVIGRTNGCPSFSIEYGEPSGGKSLRTIITRTPISAETAALGLAEVTRLWAMEKLQ